VDPALPPVAVLQEAVDTLHARGDSSAVVRVVEAWGARGEPSLRARLRQGIAFHRVRLLDRAMARALEVLKAEPRNTEALRLLAEVYLDRGWPSHARKPLATLRELGVEVDAFWLRAHEEPARPEANARDVEREGDPARTLALAEAFLAAGSLLRARGILERLRRTDSANRRVRELLWAMDGDFSLSPVELQMLVDDASPDAAGDEVEHTETVLIEPRAAEPQSTGPAAFATLFQGQRSRNDLHDPSEVTQSSAIGALTGPPAAPTGGDTQIMLVIRPGERPSGTAHRMRDVTDAHLLVERNLDLGAWKSAMGMRADVSDIGDDAANDLLEAEDEDVVVVTRHESDLPRDDSDEYSQPIEVIDNRPAVRPTARSRALPVDDDEQPTVIGIVPGLLKDVKGLPALSGDGRGPAPSRNALPGGRSARSGAPTGERRPGATPPPGTAAAAPPRPSVPASGTVSHAAGAAPTATSVAASKPGSTSPPPAARPPPSPRAGGAPRRSLLVAGSALLGAVALGLGGLFLGMRGLDPQTDRATLLTAVAPQSWEALQAAESSLLPSAEGGSSSAQLALATVRMIAWEDYDPDPARRTAVGSALGPGDGTSELRVRVALADHDLPGATAALPVWSSETDAEGTLVAARVALASGSLDAAESLLTSIPTPALRYRLALAELRIAQGRVEDAAALLRADVAVPYAALRLDTLLALGVIAGEAPTLPALATLPPRLAARGYAARAERALRNGGAAADLDAAVTAGLAADPTHPRLRWLDTARQARTGQLRAAADVLGELLLISSRDGDVRVARVLVLLDLDRLDEARTVLEDAAAQGLGNERVGALRTLLALARSEAPPAVNDTSTPLGAWADAKVAVATRRGDVGASLARARTALETAPDPWLRRIAPQAQALQLTIGGAPPTAESLNTAVAAAPDDAQVLLAVGRAWELAGVLPLAAKQYDRATELAPELADAWAERARLNALSYDGAARAAESRARYLALEPSGPRAARIAAVQAEKIP
jgi:tetratricopeptide (TPR) repeat protein